MKDIKVTFNTLTPIWTGDAWGECNKLKLTGIIGSLRWWFETLVRGMGYKACYSTGDKCEVEIKNPEDVFNIHEKICPVCYLFGTTGWKSRFSVVTGNNTLSKLYNGKVVVKINGGSGWHYESGLMGEVTFKFQYDETILKETFSSILRILLYLISEYGMLGAKTSMGYGVVKFQIKGNDISVTEDDWKNFEDYLQLFDKNKIKDLKDKEKKKQEELPSLKDFFFMKFNVTNSIDNVINNVKKFFNYQNRVIETKAIDKWKEKNWCITSPVVRKSIREEIKKKFKGNDDLRHFLMGNIQKIKALKEKDPTRFSAIQVSHIYKKNNNLEFRIYGWLPDIKPINGNVDGIIELLTELFENSPPWNSNLPSTIRNNICWDESGLKKVNSNIESLFIKKKEKDNQGDVE